jgi:ATP-dependent DNA ligase
MTDKILAEIDTKIARLKQVSAMPSGENQEGGYIRQSHPAALRMKRTTDIEISFSPPMECLPVNDLPDDSDWRYELKLDGFRGQAIRDDRGVRLLSRNGKDFSKKFPLVFAALQKALPMGTAVDGELVAFDETGHPSFNAIQNASPETNIVFFVFDVLVNRWKDVKNLALRERLSLLRSAVVPCEREQLSEHFEGSLSLFVAAVQEMGGEGVVAKRLTSRYEQGKRTGAWVKKRLNIGQEFVIGGFTPGSNGVDALVVGYYEGVLIRAGALPSPRQRRIQCRRDPVVGAGTEKNTSRRERTQSSEGERTFLNRENP